MKKVNENEIILINIRIIICDRRTNVEASSQFYFSASSHKSL